jgi:hypothetical protein
VEKQEKYSIVRASVNRSSISSICSTELERIILHLSKKVNDYLEMVADLSKTFVMAN